MQSLLEHFGVAVGAITGVLAARGKQIDLFGVLVLALVAAFGGGTCRDVLLGCHPIFWISHPAFLLNASLTAVLGFYLVRYHELPAAVLLVADAFALAFFTMLGVRKGLDFGVTPPIAVIMGVMTGVAGGIMRDLLVGEIPLVFRHKTYLYATAAFGGASLYVLLAMWMVDPRWNMAISTVATLLLRLAGIRWKITLPVFRPKNSRSSHFENQRCETPDQTA